MLSTLSTLKSRLAFLLLILLFAGCATAPPATQRDPIDTLVQRLASTNGMFMNGLFSPLTFSSTTSPEQLVPATFQVEYVANQKVGSFNILQARQVRIKDSPCDPVFTAVLVKTNLGRVIVLLQYDSSFGWWNRVYYDNSVP